MVNIKLNLTQENAEHVKSAVCPIKYDKDGKQYRFVPTWLMILSYLSADANGLDRVMGECLYLQSVHEEVLEAE